MRPENGPPLPLASCLRGSIQLQSVPPFPRLLVIVLLGLLCSIVYLGLE